MTKGCGAFYPGEEGKCCAVGVYPGMCQMLEPLTILLLCPLARYLFPALRYEYKPPFHP